MFILFFLRFFVFTLYESPKYLMGKGRDEEAVAVVHKVATYNGKSSSLKVEHLKAAEREFGRPDEDTKEVYGSGSMDVGTKAALKRQLSKFNFSHVKSLFATRKLAWSTSLLIILWGM